MKKKEVFFYGKNRKKQKTRAEGFTFVETLAVLAIGAVLSAGSVVSATKLISMAKKTSARSQIDQFSSALQAYFLDCGRFPTSEQGLSALWERPVLYPVPENWQGPYLDREPGADPWGTNFEYISAESSLMPSEVPENLPFVLMSYGADKKKGGQGEACDIVSWK
ncbi:MAG: type II secretion system major pseudopilin GspG [Treponema sp.]|nr:type II secretion system major pseudopilin GspG [Treponema sp.]